MKTVLAALLAVSLVLPTSDVFAAEKKEGQKLQRFDQSEKPNMTRRYRAAKAKYRIARYRASQRARTYRTSRARAYYRTQRCDPFMRQWFGVCN